MNNQLQKAVDIIPRTRTILQEFLGLLADKKPVILTGLEPNDLSIIKKSFPELYFSYAKNCYNPKLTLVAISKNKLLATVTATLLDTKMKSNDYFRLIGILLGYPQCCIENFLKYIDDDDEKRYNTSVITYNSSKSSKQHSKYCNNLLNFSTRINENRIDYFSKFLLLNQNLPLKIENYQYISHIPCRYDCQESIKIGMETEELLKKYAPKIYETILPSLSNPVLYFDLFELIIFDGHLNNGVLNYKKVLPPFGLIKSVLLKAINKGNKIETDAKNIYIYKDESLIYVYKRKNERDGFFLDFK